MYISKWSVADLSVGYQFRVSDVDNLKGHQRKTCPHETLAWLALGKSESWMQLAFDYKLSQFLMS